MHPALASVVLSLLLACQSESSKIVPDTGPSPTPGDVDADGFTTAEGDCDDARADVNPAAAETCDGVDQNCDGAVDEGVLRDWYADTDGDGFGDADARVPACESPPGHVASGTDCDDSDAGAFPTAVEDCDGVDNDCDGDVDEDGPLEVYADADGDGHGDDTRTARVCVPEDGWVVRGGDCDDADPLRHPGAGERCDGLDDDCDGLVDDADPDLEDGRIWYIDRDRDGYGADDYTLVRCDLPAGYDDDAYDCDDSDATAFPGAVETPDGTDEDCDGTTDEGTTAYDDDGDGFSEAAGDCDDADASVSPGAVETPDGVDEDCDGTTDEGTSVYDDDGDGFSEAAGDCDDADRATHPGAREVCDGDDDDCDGLVDDADPDRDASTGAVFHGDGDGDGFGAPAEVWACVAPAAHVSDGSDCDDADGSTFPGAPEPCGSGDRDCDGSDALTCESCQAIADAGWSGGDGVYTIDPDGAGAAWGDTDAWCDMSTDGGGWTLLQRTVWSWSESALLQTGYAAWYGATLGLPDAGEAYRIAGQAWDDLLAGGDMMIVVEARDETSGASCDRLYYTGAGGSYSVSASAATVVVPPGTGGVFGNVAELSTSDSGPSSRCANSPYDGTPWFYASCCTTCFTFKGTYWTDEAHPMVGYADTRADLYGHVAADVCPSGAAVNSINYEGANALELYVR